MFARYRIENYTYRVNAIFYQYCRHISLSTCSVRLRCERKRVKYPRCRQGRRCQRQGNVDDVNSISNQHRRCRDTDNVDDVNVKEISAMSTMFKSMSV